MINKVNTKQNDKIWNTFLVFILKECYLLLHFWRPKLQVWSWEWNTKWLELGTTGWSGQEPLMLCVCAHVYMQVWVCLLGLGKGPLIQFPCRSSCLSEVWQWWAPLAEDQSSSGWVGSQTTVPPPLPACLAEVTKRCLMSHHPVGRESAWL